MIFAVFQTAFYPQLAKSSAKLVVMHSVQDGQADRREAPAGDIMDHIAAFFDARIAALTGAGIKRNRLVLDPGMGFFLGAAPETSLSVLARFDELRLRFDLPVLLSVSRKSFLRALTGRGPGMSGPRHFAAELAAAAGGADFIRTRAAPFARRAGGIGGAERNRKNSLTAHSGYFSIFAVQQACPFEGDPTTG